MSQDESLKNSLMKQFSFLDGQIRITRPRRIFVKIAMEQFRSVFEYAARDLKFVHLCTITGLDCGETLNLIYHLAHDSGTMLNIETSVPKQNPVIKTVTDIFYGAEIYEREVMDLLGFKIEGLPPGNRYPLTDEAPKDQFPLRKDWKAPTTHLEEDHTHA